MKCEILKKATEMFLNFGFKSVTMDDIANKMGISKKTIYAHFQNKTKLVEATAIHVFESIANGIDCICTLNKNPIEEIYEIKQFVMKNLKNEKSSPQFQLQKYYPEIYSSLKSKQYDVMQDCVKDNLKRGIKQGLYRDSINKDIVSRIYFNCMMALKDKDLFPQNEFPMKQLMENYLEYHLRGICTPKGLDILIQFTTSNQS